jgi:uncharacterized protein (DUF983 family)
VENDRDVPIIPKADFVAIFAIGIKWVVNSTTNTFLWIKCSCWIINLIIQSLDNFLHYFN